MEIIFLILGALIVGAVVVFVSPALYDRAKILYIEYVAKPAPILNIIKVQKINFNENYVGGGNFFHTVNGKGRLIHLVPDFNEELLEENLSGGFFDIPDDCNGCTEYMFHIKNTNNKTIRNLKLKFKIEGKLFDSDIKFVHPEKKITTAFKCEDNICEMNILRLSPLETLSFGILATNPGNLTEIFCDIQDGKCAPNHFSLFYSDIMIGSKKVFLNYNGKEYPLPAINNSSEKRDYQLINGVWTEYK